jgi:predicted GIY-YIG superfamily endonuclease
VGKKMSPQERAKMNAEAQANATKKERIKLLKQEKDLSDARLKRLTDDKASIDAISKATKEATAATLAHLKAVGDDVDAILKQEKALKDLDKAQKEALKTVDELTNAQNSFGSNLENTVTALTGVTSGSDSLVGSWMNMKAATSDLKKEIKELEADVKKLTDAEEDAAEASDELTEATEKLRQKKLAQADAEKAQTESIQKYLKKLNPVAGMLIKVLQVTTGLALANDAATSAFNKSSGAAGAYDNELMGLEISNRVHGISTAELSESYGALQASLSGFGVMAKSERTRLGELTAQFAKIGVSAADTAGILQTLTGTFGMSTQAATRMQEEAMELAQTLGKDVGQVMSELNQTLPKLAAYGDDASRMFVELQKAAQRTKLEIGELVDLTSKFDTFDSAATAAGNLNAVLGTQSFSAMSFLESIQEGGDSLVNYLTDTLQASGTAWESLEYFQRQSLANAAGLDVATLSNIMNAEAQTQQEKDRAQSLEDTMKAGRAMWDELKIAGVQMALAIQPVLSIVVGTIGKLNAGMAWLSEEMPFLANLIKATFAVAGLMAFVGAIQMVTAAYTAMTKASIFAKAFSGPVGWGILAAGTVAAAVAITAWQSSSQSVSEEPSQYNLGTGSGRVNAGTSTVTAEEGIEGYLGRNGEAGLLGVNGPQIHPRGELAGGTVIPNPLMTDFARAARNPEQGGSGGDNTAVVAAVRALGQKLDAVISAITAESGEVVIKLNDDIVGRRINKQLGQTGSQPILVKTFGNTFVG